MDIRASCKKQSIKEDSGMITTLKWIDDLILSYVPDIQNPAILTLQKKLDCIQSFIKATVKARDDALAKNQPLVQKLLLKDKVMDEKALEHNRALESKAAREEMLKHKLAKMESLVESKDLELQKARKETERVKDEWHKKLQRGFDKIGVLEKKYVFLKAIDVRFGSLTKILQAEIKERRIQISETGSRNSPVTA